MLGYVKIEIQTRDKDIQISDRHIYTSRGLVLVRKRQIKVRWAHTHSQFYGVVLIRVKKSYTLAVIYHWKNPPTDNMTVGKMGNGNGFLCLVHRVSHRLKLAVAVSAVKRLYQRLQAKWTEERGESV
ncbi:hypothetical protein SUGI_1157070 [Cryptomeria japonica]|nr:hypothetical protein SUGI_1157070 [Cryptomeria japonica]